MDTLLFWDVCFYCFWVWFIISKEGIGIDDFGYKVVTMYFTNDPIFGKARFQILAKNLSNFLKGYKKRKN